jgi:5-methylcytosine-specific restriction endonuclease McrA
MSRLTNIKPGIRTVAPQLATIQRDVAERERFKARDQAMAWRAWYRTARWQALRQQTLIRDLYRCQKTGVLLSGKHPAPNSPVVDHIKPHSGDPALFWDEANLQAVSKEYHDSIKQAVEHADRVAAVFPDWLKPSLIPLTMICGPAASGKSTYARQHASSDDLIIDLDVIASNISGEPLHGWNRNRWLNAALYYRNNQLGDLGRLSRYRAAWFIVSAPEPEHRRWWQDKLKPRETVIIEASEMQCITNASNDTDRDQKRTADQIVRWWFDYRPRPGETVVRL